MKLLMGRILLLTGFFFFWQNESGAQNCVPTYTAGTTPLNGSVYNLPCGQNCIDINFQTIHHKKTSDYIVVNIPYNPFPYLSATGAEDPVLYADDEYSATIPLPFQFPFYDSIFSNAVVGSNGLLTFDYLANANCDNAWVINQLIPYAGGAPCIAGQAYYPRSSIMGAYSDLDPRFVASPADRLIQWHVEGTAPCRKFVVSYYHVGVFGNTCGVSTPNTFQIVIFESTGIVEVHFEAKTCFSTTNAGRAILGIQNWNKDLALAAPGKNNTSWTSFNEGYRFVPNAGTSNFVSSELKTLAGVHVAWGDTTTTTAGLLDIRFPNVCQAANSAQYTVTTLFQSNADPNILIYSIDTVTINRTTNLNATATTTPTTCGPPTGTITVTVPSNLGAAPFSYSLDGGAAQTTNNRTYTFNNVAAGPHSVFVTDNTGCSSTIPVTLVSTGTLNVTASTTATSCAGVNNGSITVTPPTGTAPFQYSINGGPLQASNIFNNLAPGSYTVSVTDAGGCIGNTTVNVTTGSSIAATTSSTPTSCSGANNGTITVTPTSGTAPYQYSLNGGAYQSSNTFTNLAAASYFVVVQDANGCTSNTLNVSITAGTTITGNATSTPTSCTGVNNGTISVTPTSGTAPYQYSLDGGPYQASNIFNNVAAGPHTIVFQDAGGCISGNIAVTVVGGSGLTANTATTNTSCNGVNNGTITVTPTNGTAPYQFSLDGGAYQTGNSFTNVAAGSHTVVVLDALGCTSGNINVTVATGAGVTGTAASTATSCNGVNNGTITINPTNGAAPYQYSLDGGPYQASNVFTNVAAGSHTVVFQDAAGCVSGNIPVTVATGAGVSGTAASAATSCNGATNGTITVTASNGTTPYQYSLNGGAVQASNVFTNVAAGNHTIVITDAAGCISSNIPVTVAAGGALTGTAATIPTSCNGVNNGTITVTPTSGVGPYQYSLDGGANQASNVFTNVAAGSHNIIFQDVAGCVSNSIAVTVGTGTGVTGSATSTATSCNTSSNGSITVNASTGSAPYQYSLNGAANQASNVFNNVAAGSHVIVITDAAGCVSTNIPVTVVAGAAITGTTATTATSCNGVNNGTVTITASSNATTPQYSLDGGAFQASNIFTNVSAGNHTIVIQDAAGCSSAPVPVTVPAGAGVTGSASSTATSCTGATNGTITANAAGGASPYQYSLNGGAAQAGNVFTNVAAGNHNVVITDAAGCISPQVPITVAVGPGLTAAISQSNVSCNGLTNGSFTVNVNAPATPPFQYSLDNITFQASNIFNNLAAGSYTVYFRDNLNCTGTQTVTINQPAVLSMNVTAQPVRCNGQNNGVITITASGGTSPYQYSLDNINYQSSTTFNVAAGTFTVYVRDNNSCLSSQAGITVTQPAMLSLSAVAQNASCNGNGMITATAGGGTTGYQYSIDGVNFQSSNQFNTTTGNYTVTVRDANNCTTTTNAIVGLTNNLVLTPGNDTIICEGATAKLYLNTNATQFSWTPAASLDNASIASPVASPTATTQYNVTATLGSCSTNGMITVNVNRAPVANAALPDIDICFGQDAQLNASGGVSYQWTPTTYLSNPNIANPISIKPPQSIQYNFHVTDANGCRSLTPGVVRINVIPPIKVTVTPRDTIVSEGDQIQLNASSIATNYSWTNGSTLSNPNIANPIATIPPGSLGMVYVYTVTATTAAGCSGTASSVILKVYKGPDLYMPTGFTPNADGKNDKFAPVPVGIKRIVFFRVFDRWGQLMFSTSQMNEGWDGTKSGVKQASGVYVWVVQGVTKDDKVIFKKGTVTLVR